MIGANLHFSRQARSRTSVKKEPVYYTIIIPMICCHREHTHDMFHDIQCTTVSKNPAMSPRIRDEIKDVPQDGSNDVPAELVVLDGDLR